MTPFHLGACQNSGVSLPKIEELRACPSLHQCIHPNNWSPFKKKQSGPEPLLTHGSVRRTDSHHAGPKLRRAPAPISAMSTSPARSVATDSRGSAVPRGGGHPGPRHDHGAPEGGGDDFFWWPFGCGSSCFSEFLDYSLWECHCSGNIIYTNGCAQKVGEPQNGLP